MTDADMSKKMRSHATLGLYFSWLSLGVLRMSLRRERPVDGFVSKGHTQITVRRRGEADLGRVPTDHQEGESKAMRVRVK